MRVRDRTLTKALRSLCVPVPAVLVTVLLVAASADDAFA